MMYLVLYSLSGSKHEYRIIIYTCIFLFYVHMLPSSPSFPPLPLPSSSPPQFLYSSTSLLLYSSPPPLLPSSPPPLLPSSTPLLLHHLNLPSHLLHFISTFPSRLTSISSPPLHLFTPPPPPSPLSLQGVPWLLVQAVLPAVVGAGHLRQSRAGTRVHVPIQRCQ